MLRIFIDGTEINDTPKKWQDFTVTLVRDYTDRVIRYRYPTDLIFYGDGYRLIKSIIDSQGYNRVLDVLVQGELDGQVIFTGYHTLFLTDTTVDSFKGEISVILKDNNYISRIDNNKRIKVAANAATSKNGLELPFVSSIPLTMFDEDGASGGGTKIINPGAREGIDFKVAMEQVIAFYTDKKVGFASSWYDNLGYGIALVKGETLRLGNTNTNTVAPVISFWEVWRDFSNMYNLWLVMDIKNPLEPVIRIEEESYIYNTTELTTLEEVEGVKESYEQSLLYSAIRLGAGTTTNPNGYSNLNILQLAGFQLEEYYLQTEVNLDNVLDLTVSGGIIDNNTILDVLQNPDQDETYDKNTFYIAYGLQFPFNNKPLPYAFYGLAGGLIAFYNQPFNNLEVSKRYQLYDTITTQLDNIRSLDLKATSIATDSNTFTAFDDVLGDCQVSAYLPFTLKANYSAEQIDAANAWNTNTYTATAVGVYTFEVETLADATIQGLYLGGKSRSFRHSAYLTVNSGERNTPAQSVLSTNFTLPMSGLYSVRKIDLYSSTNTFSVFLNVGDTVNIEHSYFVSEDICEYVYLKFDVKPGSSIKIIKHPLSGVTLPAADPVVLERSYFITKQRYTKGLTKEQAKLILENPINSVILQRSQGSLLRTWIKQADINLFTGVAEIESISNLNNR